MTILSLRAAPRPSAAAVAAMLTIVSASLSACARPAATPASTSAGEWRSEPPMNRPRAAHAVVATGDAIYAMGGTDEEGSPVMEVERFDGDRWVVESQLPGSGLNAPAAAHVGGRIYLVAGFETDTNVPSDRLLIYDLATRSWSEGPRLPAPRGGHAAVVLDGRIHVFGGGNSMATIADHSMFDPATARWAELAPLPFPRGSPAGVAYDGRVWSVGGRSGSADFGDVDIYDPAADRWVAGPPVPPRGTAGAVVYDGAIHLVGGESQAEGRTLTDLLRLDTVTGVWSDREPMPTARNYARAVLLRDAVYVVGGSPLPVSSHASPGTGIVESYRTGRG